MTQEEALDILKTGRSAFITGAAGSGKTHLLNRYISWLKEVGVPVAITASTGIAATHMGGLTIHAWSGIGIRDSLSYEEAEALAEKTYLRNQVRGASVLIIDEVSMLHDYRLDMVDTAVRALKGIPMVFGGMQVILSGDFFQLPPITRSKSFDQDVIQLEEESSHFVYHSNAWHELNPVVCYLEEQHRQDDPEYLGILNAIRENTVQNAHHKLLETRIGATLLNESPTKIYAFNVNVDEENNNELESISKEVFEYHMSARGPDPLVLALKKGCLAPEVLRLKVGAKIMFVKNNFDAGYANGTTGTIQTCSNEGICVLLQNGSTVEVEPASFTIEENGKVKAEVIQYPLRLAWAITIHKSQGLTLDSAEIDLSQPFEKGMGYVALSRVKSLAGLSLKGFHKNAFLVHEEAQEKDIEFRAQSKQEVALLKTISKTDIKKLQEAFIRENGARTKEKKKPTAEITLELFLAGKDIGQISRERSLTVGTILEHLESMKEKDPSVSFFAIRDEFSTSRLQKIMSAFQKIGTQEGGKRLLGPVYELLGGKIPYDELRKARLLF
jgi:ATP-dependent DNA helicase PIF1